jgi:hypothetical protein
MLTSAGKLMNTRLAKQILHPEFFTGETRRLSLRVQDNLYSILKTVIKIHVVSTTAT